LLFAAVLATAAGCGGSDSVELRGMTRTPALAVGDVRLPEHAGSGGRRGAMRAPDSGLLLAYFGYTSCPDVCPTTMSDIAAALRQLTPQQRRRVTVGLVTVDPRRDTVRVMRDYMSHFFPAGGTRIWRTTDVDELRRSERAFGATHSTGPADESGAYEVAHSAVTYVIDDRGRVLVEWPFGTVPADIAADLEALLARPSTSQSDQREETE
jgi:protein SCO1/2